MRARTEFSVAQHPKARVLFVTQRSPHHQQAALKSAPEQLDITMVRAVPADRDALSAYLPSTDFWISERAGVIDAAMIAQAPNLRLIQRLGSLHFDMDVAAAHAAGVRVCATPVRGSILVAEHMLMQMLALVKRLPEATATAASTDQAAWGESQRTDENTFAYNWSGRRGIDGLLDQTIGIVGFGEIGVELTRRLQPFRPAGLLYHKRNPLPEAVEKDLGVVYAPLDELGSRCDILCNLLPYSAATDGLLNEAFFQQMPVGSFVVSCGSGSVIDEAALAAALSGGHLAGAALDTFEWEPLQGDNPLLRLARQPDANVLLTPHTAAGTTPLRKSTRGTTGRSSDYDNILRLLNGEALHDEISL